MERLDHILDNSVNIDDDVNHDRLVKDGGAQEPPDL
jgi:hypothetical protein